MVSETFVQDVSRYCRTEPWLTSLPFVVGDYWHDYYCIAAGNPGTWMYPDSMALLDGESAEIVHEPRIEVWVS